MNCSICHDIVVDEAYARCEWCRFGAPMEASLEGPSFLTGEGRNALGRAMSSIIMDNLKRQSASRFSRPVQQVDPTIKAVVDLHANHPISPQPITKDSIRDLNAEKTMTKMADALCKGLGVPKQYLGLSYSYDASTHVKYMMGWDNIWGKK